ncbi:hypothetical protein BP5796_08337 [Coleophoma crateriformis]|uniref:Mediator of RNA polymerase II transcription subunit 8 n=1 Tax=Coleophoma crateriformis TaxID=565419 RepID=A0A3D8R7M2_9HELO|nr:hypothetical protein BP5796_08337 [Coleophoma crateriformis]
MSDPRLRQEDLKALEQTRQKLFTLSNNIGSLRNEMMRSNPLPDWASLQTSAAILARNLQNLTSHLSGHADLLERTVVYPSTNYPGRTQENLLVQLVRKRLEPPVEEWVAEGRAIEGNTKDEEDFSKWAQGWIGERIATYAMEEGGDNFTAEEREMGIENVRTGLRRKFEDDDESEEDDDDEDEDRDQKMEDTLEGELDVTVVRKSGMGPAEFELGQIKTQKKRDGPVRSFEDILEFSTRGEVLPKQEMRR